MSLKLLQKLVTAQLGTASGFRTPPELLVSSHGAKQRWTPSSSGLAFRLLRLLSDQAPMSDSQHPGAASAASAPELSQSEVQAVQVRFHLRPTQAAVAVTHKLLYGPGQSARRCRCRPASLAGIL